jgi:two-component system, chemotaxis family, protein-glutamate methylesterase/glutaminase
MSPQVMTANGKPSTNREVRVLIADDSATVRWHLTDVINTTPGLRVIGEARDGAEVLALAPQLKPDVISMDINMPRMDGLEATRRLMVSHPTPVVVVSGLVDRDVDLALQALQAGALAVVEKPPDRSHPAFAEKHRQLVKNLIAMSGVRVIRRGQTAQLNAAAAKIEYIPAPHPRINPEIIAVGASAGGPGALSTLFKLLPSSLSIPVVVVQHMPHEFILGLARWLGKSSGWTVRVASDGAILEGGVVHLSPGTAHLKVIRQGGRPVARLITEQGSYRYQPAVDVLFHSIAQTFGAAAIGVIMTGMGDDGAEGLLAMRQAGARTLAQDQASSVVFGMANVAIERGAVEDVLPLIKLPEAIRKLL